MHRIYKSITGSPSALSHNAREDQASTAIDVSRNRHRRHIDREVQELGGNDLPRTSQHELIHQLRIAFTKIGRDRVSREIETLSSRSQENLVETIRACIPELAQHDDALAKSHNARGEPLSQEGAGNLNEIRKLHLKELADSTAENNALHKTILELQSQLDLSNAEVHRLQDEQKPMLDAILDKSAGQKPMEHDLKKDFGDLRNVLKGLGISRVFASSGKLTCPHVAQPSPDDEFYSAWHAANTNDRRLLIRMWMFRFLHDKILDQPVFDVPSIATTSRTEKRDFGSVERSLGRLEVALQARRIPEEDIVKWRRATLKCVQSCEHDDSFSEYWAASMYNIFERLIVEDTESSEIEKLKQRFSQVCRTAVRIRLAMRDQDKRYRCVVLKRGQLLADYEHIAEWSAVFKGKIDEPGPHIIFTLFGALVKQPEDEDGEEAVLVMADVAMDGRGS